MAASFDPNEAKREPRAGDSMLPPPIDRQRLYHGPGSAGMGGTRRLKNAGGGNVNAARANGFKIRKRGGS